MGASNLFEVNKTTLIVIETIFSFNQLQTKEEYLKLSARIYEKCLEDKIYPKHIVDAFESAMLLIDFMTDGDCRDLRNIYI